VTAGQALLWPLSIPYGAVVHLRARAYEAGILRPRRLRGVVISVGNLTVGGTGKTPMVLWITERLLAERKRVAIMTRGYRGERVESNTKHTADGGKSKSESTSDEVELLRARLGWQVAIGVGANRFEKGQELAKLGAEWFVLDDGFQHQQLARDVDIVLIDATDPFGGGRLLPAGRLRERRTALSRADILVITRSDHAPAIEAAVRRDSDAPIFYARPRPEAVRTLRNGYPGEATADAQAKKLLAFCGIGNPTAFISDLRNWGLNIVGQKFFPDHHRYTNKDFNELERQAHKVGAAGLICTEKDVFNLGNNRLNSLEICYCPISMEVGVSEEFWRALKEKAESQKHSRG
jgi:tetraacyldisaccharide 4'-kinase